MKRTKIYVGYNKGKAQKIFRALSIPTQKSHGHLYAAVVGPFRTKKGAQFMLNYGDNNPHCQCVADAERLAKWWEKHEALHQTSNELVNSSKETLCVAHVKP